MSGAAAVGKTDPKPSPSRPPFDPVLTPDRCDFDDLETLLRHGHLPFPFTLHKRMPTNPYFILTQKPGFVGGNLARNRPSSSPGTEVFTSLCFGRLS